MHANCTSEISLHIKNQCVIKHSKWLVSNPDLGKMWFSSRVLSSQVGVSMPQVPYRKRAVTRCCVEWDSNETTETLKLNRCRLYKNVHLRTKKQRWPKHMASSLGCFWCRVSSCFCKKKSTNFSIPLPKKRQATRNICPANIFPVVLHTEPVRSWRCR